MRRRLPSAETAAAWGIPALLILHAAAVAFLAWRTPMTVDEPGHVVSGLYTIRTGRADLYNVNPPPVKVLAALPLHLLGTNWDFTGVDTRPGVRTEWSVGGRWAESNERHRVPTSVQLFLARLAVLPFSLLGGWACGRWSRELFGPAGGLLSCGLWCASPLVLTNAAVLSTDVPAAACGVLAGWRLWHLLKRPDGFNVFIAGLSLGAALLCKFTWVVAFGLWPLIAVIWYAAGGRASCGKDGTPDPPSLLALSGKTAAALAVALATFNVGYGFDGTFTALGEYRFVSRALTGGEHRQFHGAGANRFAGTVLGRLPVPLPGEAVRGLDLQRVDFELAKPALVNGEKWERPRWWGYPYHMLRRVPAAAWAAWLLAAWGSAADVRRWAGGSATAGERVRAAGVVLILATALMALVCSQAHTLFYVRYALPAFGFLAIWAGRACGGGEGDRRQAAVAIALLAAAAAEFGWRGI